MYQQQGDVLLFKIDAVPANAQKAKVRNRIVLAKGEATGHSHAIVDVAEGCELYTLADALFVNVGVPVTVVHEEHDDVTLDPGVWRVAIVREHDHFREESRKVVD